MPFYWAFPDVPLVSISDDQRAPMPPVNWVRTIHHGLPRDLYRYSPRAAGGYLAFLGRISPEKRPDRAIEIATRAGMKLRIAAKVDNADLAYWQEEIEPLVRANPLVEYRGRDQRAREGRLPRRRYRAPLPHRLAGTLRPRHDRGNGLRHADHRLFLRLRP
jgi:glycosyltransferase involved in cell wall biosynthesis